MSERVRINAIAAGGDGVGTLGDGRAVFVPRTAPGDVVELGQVVLAKRFARARLARLLEPSPDRVQPPCPHYEADECGSCQLQHLSAPAQRAVRQRLVGDALRRIGHLEVDDPPLEASETEWGYRAKISLAIKAVGRSGGRAVETGGDRKLTIGYHRLGRPGQVFDLTRCPIARPELNALWARLREHRDLLPGTAGQIILRVDRAGASHAIVRAGRTGGTGRTGRTGRTDAWTRAKELGRVLEREGIPVVLWWEPEGGAVRTVAGASEAYPAMVFEQVHPAMGDRVRRYAVSQLGELAGRHIWDLYAGIGETTRAIVGWAGAADRADGWTGAMVESVEVDPRAVRIAEARGSSTGVGRVIGRVEEVTGQLRPADSAIVNPPRTGLGGEATDRLNARPPERLVYVSCDPATLARDLARLTSAYRLTDLRAFDLFPQTAHVETVATLERR